MGMTITSTLAMAVRLMTPLLFAALGGMIAQKAGIYNFALEGMMLGGALSGYFFALVSGSLWVGFLGAMLIGGLFGMLLAWISIRFGVSQLVVCLGFNTFFLGITGYFYRLLDKAGLSLPLPKMFGEISIPLLSDIPLIGPVLFKQNILVYLAVFLTLACAWFMKRTQWGLALKAVGEYPAAADSSGIPVFRYRYLATMISGMLAAAGGAFLTLSQVSRFLENMIEGRGWIAIAAIILGKWNPIGVLAACGLFGVATAISNQLQILGVNLPYQVTMMVPYALTMLALLGFVGKGRGPSAVGKPYMKK